MIQGRGSLIGFLFHVPIAWSGCSIVDNTVKLWNKVSENALVRSSNVKKFKRNLFDSVMCKFTPDSFKIDFLKQLDIFLKFLSMCKFE